MQAEEPVKRVGRPLLIPLEDVYRYMEQKTKSSNGIPPSLSEIADQFKLSSSSSAKNYVERLVENGLVERVEIGKRIMYRVKSVLHVMGSDAGDG